MSTLKLNHHGWNLGVGEKFDFATITRGGGGGGFLRFGGMRNDEKQGICLNCCSGVENGRVITMSENDYFNSSIASVTDSTAAEDEFVRMMREAQPYFLAHRDRTFVLLLSAEIIDSPYLSSILKVRLEFKPSILNIKLCKKIINS